MTHLAFSRSPSLNIRTAAHLLLETIPTWILLNPEATLSGLCLTLHSGDRAIYLGRHPCTLGLRGGVFELQNKSPPTLAPTYCLSVGTVGPEGDGHGVEHAHLASHLLHPPHRTLLVSVCKLDHQAGGGSLQPGRHMRSACPSLHPSVPALPSPTPSPALFVGVTQEYQVSIPLFLGYLNLP